MAKHSYCVCINRIPASREPIEYTFRRTACTLSCSKDAAAVRFEMSVKKQHDDLISFRVDLVKDAMRKMYLIHAMRYDARLRVRSVTVTIDGESRVYEQGFPGFPFLYSMLTAKSLDLPESWHSREFLTKALTATKSVADNDLRYACLFYFLAGTGRAYESEKFISYWTAVNSLYNHLLSCAQPRYAAELGAASYDALPHRKQVLSGDTTGLSALLRVHGCGGGLGSRADRDACKSQYGAVKSHLRGYSREELHALYAELHEHRSDPAWIPEGPLGEHLRACMARTGLSAWGFLLLDYAYYIRCNYLHGSKAALLFSAANDPEIAAFRALNVFLGEYLKETIPQIFREDWFTQEMYRAVRSGVK